MVMGEEISRLMDGELDEIQVDLAYGQLKRPDGMATWVCYHVIGDTLRGGANVAPGFAQRFTTRLASEPTVLAPRSAGSRPLTHAWAVAAGMAAVALVGWVAFNTWQPDRATLAKASQGAIIGPPRLQAQAVPADYILVHHEYSPTTQIQGVGLYGGGITPPATAGEARP
jgi:sigma-E factor negative regulatory protein RseA